MIGLELDLLTILTILSVCIVAAALLMSLTGLAVSLSLPEPEHVRPHMTESTVA